MSALAAQVDQKRLATAQARIALWGGVLSLIHGDDGRPEFIVSRWAMTRAFSSLDEVDVFIERVEGKRP